MKNEKKQLARMLAVMLGSGSAVGIQAAPLLSGDILTINAGVPVYDGNGYQIGVSSGSYFGTDADASHTITDNEKWAVSQDMQGILIGYPQGPGQIASAVFYNAPSQFYTTSPVTGDTTNGLDFSGWTWLWNGGVMPMHTGAWNPTASACVALGIPDCSFASGNAQFIWDGIYGHSYQLWYTATGINGAVVGFPFFWYLEGTVLSMEPPPVPVPAAAWLFGSGLLGLVGCVRRRQ